MKGEQKDISRKPKKSEKEINVKTKLNIGKSKESERKPNGKPKGNNGNPKENQRTSKAAGSSQKHPQAISSKKQPGTARISQEQ